MPDQESRDSTGRPPIVLVMRPGDGFPPDEPRSRGASDRKGQAPVPDAIELRQSRGPTSGLAQRSNDPEQARRNRPADASDASAPRPNAVPQQTHRGTGERINGRRDPQGNPKGNPV